jgi:hypothetical protein
MEAAFVAAVLALAHRKRIASLFFPCIAAHQSGPHLLSRNHGGALSRIARPCAASRRREPDGRANDESRPAKFTNLEPAQGI